MRIPLGFLTLIEMTELRGGETEKMSAILWVIIALILVGAVYLGAGLVNQPVNFPGLNIPTQSPEQPLGGGPGSDLKKVKTFRVEARPFEFSPKEIRVKKGDVVRIELRNMEGFHDWGVDEFNVRTRQINAGQTDTIQFTPDRAGTFEYYCSVGNHRQMGMIGKLIVEE